MTRKATRASPLSITIDEQIALHRAVGACHDGSDESIFIFDDIGNVVLDAENSTPLCVLREKRGNELCELPLLAHHLYGRTIFENRSQRESPMMVDGW
jgi:hypothetical protein